MAYTFYEYSPSGAAAMIFLVGFIICTGWHAYIVFTRRAWYFTPLVLGCICELVPTVSLSKKRKEQKTPRWTENRHGPPT